MPFVTQVPTDPIPDVYVLNLAPPQFIGAVQADVVAHIGTSSRGRVNKATFYGSMADFTQTFGPATIDPNNSQKMLTGYPTALGITRQGVQDKVFVRVGSATLATSYVHLLDGSSAAVVALHASSPGTWASSLQYSTSPGSSTGTFNLTVLNSATGEVDNFTNLPYTNTQALVDCINKGSTTIAGFSYNGRPAQLITASFPVIQAPAAPTVTTAGSDGTIPAGNYYFVLTLTDANGETIASAETGQINVSSNQHAAVTATSVSGATGWNLYATAANGAAGTETFAASGTVFGSPVSLTSFSSSTVTPPSMSTATLGTGSTVSVATVTRTNFPAVGAAITAQTAPGNDGANAPASTYLGTVGTPATGLYCMAGLDPHPNFVLFSEDKAADTTTWQAQAQAALDNDWVAVVCFPRGTSDATAKTTIAAQTAILGTPLADRIKTAWPWIGFYDATLFSATYYAAPTGYFAAVSAVQPANTSAGNKGLVGLSDIEYTISRSQLPSMIYAGINVVSATIPTPNAVGFVTDLMMSGADGFLERMTVLVAESIIKSTGRYVQQPNTPQLRQLVQQTVMDFLTGLADDGLIPANPSGATAAPLVPSTAPVSSKTKAGAPAGVQPSLAANTASTQLYYNAICDDSNNIVNGVTSSILYCDVQVTLFPNTRQLVFRLQIGPTVTVTLNQQATSGIAA